MSTEEKQIDSLYLAAIVLSAIAFITSGLQLWFRLFRQLFGSAGGFRHCKQSVIGQWNSRIKRVWIWKVFRLETIFETPKFLLHEYDMSREDSERVKILTGDMESKRATLSDEFESETVNGDLVSWLPLLNRLHDLERHCFKFQRVEIDGLSDKSSLEQTTCSMTCPAITFRKHSWDLLPPDCIRPLASSNVGTIIALAHRLGMMWKDIRPSEGVMRAEGNGQSIKSTFVRGCAIHLEYTHNQGFTNDSNRRAFDSITVPSAEADKLGFGIIPGCQSLGLPDFSFSASSSDEDEELISVSRTLDDLGIGRATQDTNSEHLKSSNNFHGLSDLLGLVAPFMPVHNSSIVQIMRPHRDVHSTPLIHYEGFAVFHSRLQECQDNGEASQQMTQVLQDFDYMRSTYGLNWLDESENDKVGNGRSIKYLEDLRWKWQATTVYFQDLENCCREPGRLFRYKDLVAAHISQALSSLEEGSNAASREYPKPGWYRQSNLGSEGKDRVAQAMHFYVDKISEVAALMAERGFEDEGLVKDAWWTMVFRAMCWYRAVSFVPERRWGNVGGMTVPWEFHGSIVPVYIG